MCRKKYGDFLEFSLDFWGFYLWKEGIFDRLLLFLFLFLKNPTGKQVIN